MEQEAPKLIMPGRPRCNVDVLLLFNQRSDTTNDVNKSLIDPYAARYGNDVLRLTQLYQNARARSFI
jgi:hypothetical protein